MMDTFLHTLLAIALAAMLAITALFLPLWAQAAVWASFMIYFREVTQKQASLYGNDFTNGWNALNWSIAKQRETFIPMAVVFIVSSIVGIFT
jgi:hypothetical protein